MSFTHPLLPEGSHQPPHFLWSFQMFGIVKFPSLFKMAHFHQQSHCLPSPSVYWQKLRSWRSKLWETFILKLRNSIFPSAMAKWLRGFDTSRRTTMGPLRCNARCHKITFFQNETLWGSEKFCLLPEQLTLLHPWSASERKPPMWLNLFLD